jgi:C1A family cysteine protease
MPMTNEELEALKEAVRASNGNWQPGHTTMTDLEPQERRLRLGYSPGPDELTLQEREEQGTARAMTGAMIADAPATPVAVDWRNKNGQNHVTSIKDQGPCTSCVAFGTAATIESRMRIIQNAPVNAVNSSALPDLSEAHLFYCGNNKIADPCSMGWWVRQALAFATSTGVVPAACFQYTSGNQTCSLCDNWQSMTTKVDVWREIASVTAMKQWLATNGPLITCFSEYDDFHAYTGGVYTYATGKLEGGHCVSCIGYDDEKQAWLCKNSWGTGWGEAGFFWIGYGQCGIDAMMWGIDSFAAIYTAPARIHAVRH